MFTGPDGIPVGVLMLYIVEQAVYFDKLSFLKTTYDTMCPYLIAAEIEIAGTYGNKVSQV